MEWTRSNYIRWNMQHSYFVKRRKEYYFYFFVFFVNSWNTWCFPFPIGPKEKAAPSRRKGQPLRNLHPCKNYIGLLSFFVNLKRNRSLPEYPRTEWCLLISPPHFAPASRQSHRDRSPPPGSGEKRFLPVFQPCLDKGRSPSSDLLPILRPTLLVDRPAYPR